MEEESKVIRKKRLFIGIDLPVSIKEQLSSIKESYSDATGINWTAKDKLHITLYFLGSTPVDLMNGLSGIIEKSLFGIQPFEMNLTEISLFPGGKSARMIWGRFDKNEQFEQLVLKLDKGLRRLLPSLKAMRKPIPHVTVARFRERNIAKTLNFENKVLHETIDVSEITLWESKLSPKGAEYLPLKRFKLAG